MNTRKLATLSLALLVPASGLCAQDRASRRVKSGMPAPEFELKDLEGKKVTLRALRGLSAKADEDGAKPPEGKVVVLDFWSIRCPISVGWEARLKEICARYSARGVVFVAINSNRAGEDQGTHERDEDIKAYCKKHAIPYRVLIDEKARVADVYGAARTPDIFVVGQKGTIRYTGLIDTDHRISDPEKRRDYLAEALDAVLAGEEPEVRDIAPKGCSIKRPRAERRGKG